MSPLAAWAMMCLAVGCVALAAHAARWVERELQIRQEIAEAERLLRLCGKLNLTIDEVLEIEQEHA